MPVGDFKKIQPKITKPNCESCGNDTWNVIEEAGGDFPIVPLQDPSGGMRVPAPAIPVVITACQNCGHLRIYGTFN